MKLYIPNSIPLIGALLGLAVGIAYYSSIMISQLFIGRPSSTWILGVIWFPVFFIKPILVCLILGILLRIVLARFYGKREMTQQNKMMLRGIFILVIIISAIAGTLKVYLISINILR